MNKIKKQNKIIETALSTFSKQGFYNTTVSQIADNLNMSVGNLYNYFPSKKSLARAAIVYVTKKLAANLRYINNKKSLSSSQKVSLFIKEYFDFTQKHPEMIGYFFRVYLSNRELFCEHEDCGFSLAKEFIDEVKILFQDGVQSGEFADKDFFVAFSSIMGILGGMTFLSCEYVLKDIDSYRDEVSKTIYNSLR